MTAPFVDSAGTTNVSWSIGSGHTLTINTSNYTASYTWNLPNSNGSSGQALTTDGTGNLSWATVATGSVTSVGVASAGSFSAALTVSGSPITSSGTIDLTLNLFTSSTAGIVPSSGGGTANFLRADGTWSAPAGPSISNTNVAYGNGSNVLTGTSDFTWNDSTHVLQLGTIATPAIIRGPDGISTNGGNLTIEAGNGTGGSFNGGNVTVIGGTAGQSTTGFNGGNAILQGGTGLGGTGGPAVGGNAIVIGGTSTGGSNGACGSVIISTGIASTATTGGTIQFQAGITSATTVLTINSSGAFGLGSSPSYGTSGQILTSQGSGSPPIWTTAGGLTSVSLNDDSTTPIYTTTPTAPSGGAVAATITLNTQAVNTVFAGPTTGSAAQPTFRALVTNDLPSGIPIAKLASDSVTVTAGTGLTGGGSVTLGSSVTLSLPTSGVTAGSYTNANITVNAEGIVTAAANGSSTSGVSSITGTANEITASASTGAVTLSLASNIILPAPSSGATLLINGVTGASPLNILSGSSATTGVPDVHIRRAGSTANNYAFGPNIELHDTTNNFGTTIQNSGGQTEIYQSQNTTVGADWLQVAYWNNDNGLVLNAPASGVALSVTGVSASSALVVTSGSSATTASGDLAIQRAGSTANNAGQGPNVQMVDVTAHTGTILQQSGGQTELWQAQNTGLGNWAQLAFWNTTNQLTLHAPTSGTAVTINAASASSGALNLASGTLLLAGSAGTSNQVLTSSGSSSAPTWANAVNSLTAGSTSTTTGLSLSSSTGSVTINGVAFTSSNQGMVPASGGGTTNFLRADGSWAVPAGGGGGSTALSGLTAATATNTISNGNNAQTWQWALTGSTTTGLAIGESAASTGGSGSQNILTIGTLSTSTANPVAIAAGGANALTINSSGAMLVGSGSNAGTSGQVLTSSGTGGPPTWTTVSGVGVATPGTIGDLFYWFESDLIPTTSGGVVWGLGNKAPWNPNVATPTITSGVGATATVASSTLNGFAQVNFPGTLSYTLPQQIFLKIFTIFVVFQLPTIAASTNYTFVCGASSSLQFRVGGTTTAGLGTLQLLSAGVTGLAVSTTGIISAGTTYQANITYNNTTHAYAYRVARAAQGSGTGAASAIGATTTAIGSNPAAGPGEFFNGNLVALIMYTRVLTSTEISNVESYLNTKYGV